MATAPTDAANLSAQYQKALDGIRADAQYSATTGTYDENKGVAGRVNSLTSSANPLFVAAGTRAKQQSASRGLLNSSMGVQAGQQAVIETATPIASADAGLYQQQQLANQAAQNDAAARNAAARGQIGMLGFTTGENARQFDASLGQRQNEFNVTSGMTQQQIDAQKEQFAQTLGMTGKDLDLRREQLGQQQQQIDAQKEQFAQSLGMNAKDLDLRRAQLSAAQQQFLMSLDQQKAQLAQQQGQFDVSQQQQASQFTSAQAQQAQQFQAQQLQQTVMAKLDADTRTQLAQLDAQSRQDIQGSSNIAGAWGTMMQSINNVQNNANLSEDTKRTLIQNNIDSFQSFANFWKKTNSNVDVSDLLNFSTAPGAGGGGGTGTPTPAVPPNQYYNPGYVDQGDRGG